MVVTHARVDAVNRYLQSTVGREKLCRFIQYFARFYVFYLFRMGASKASVTRWSELKNHIANARKFYRLLKPIEFAQTGVKSLAVKNEVLRYTAILKQAGMFFYYSCEVFVLTTAIGFYKPNNIQKITEFGQKCWLTAITASFISGLYKLKQLSVRKHMLEKSRKAIVQADEKYGTQIAEIKAKELALEKEKYDAKYNLFSDAIDFIIPSANLGWTGADEGVVGIAGMITSFMGMATQWNKLNG